MKTKSAKTVLVIEDDFISQKVLVHTIQRLGYHAVGASSGQEGLDMAVELQPDLIFMDMRLPDINGLIVTQRIHEKTPLRNVPIVTITVSDEIRDKEAALEAGCDSFITKPADPEKLEAILDKWLK